MVPGFPRRGTLLRQPSLQPTWAGKKQPQGLWDEGWEAAGTGAPCPGFWEAPRGARTLPAHVAWPGCQESRGIPSSQRQILPSSEPSQGPGSSGCCLWGRAANAGGCRGPRGAQQDPGYITSCPWTAGGCTGSAGGTALPRGDSPVAAASLGPRLQLPPGRDSRSSAPHPQRWERPAPSRAARGPRAGAAPTRCTKRGGSGRVRD